MNPLAPAPPTRRLDNRELHPGGSAVAGRVTQARLACFDFGPRRVGAQPTTGVSA